MAQPPRTNPNSPAPTPPTPSRRPPKSQVPTSFTLAEAARALPYVRRIVSDMVGAHKVAVELQTELASLPSGDIRTRIQQDFERSVTRLQALSEELKAVGVELKDHATGLIDFPGRHQGRPVYLCWRLGEESIGFFHEVTAGFSGRQPVSVLEEGTK